MPNISVVKYIVRLRRATLTEALLIALLLCALLSLSRQSDIDASLHRLDESVVDLQNKVGSESTDIQSELDDVKSELSNIEANQ